MYWARGMLLIGKGVSGEFLSLTRENAWHAVMVPWFDDSAMFSYCDSAYAGVLFETLLVGKCVDWLKICR